jgi:predicted dehydrogenase
MSKELRIGVIGASGRGHLAGNVESEELNCKLVAGADIYQESLDKFKEKHPNASTYLDYREMLDKEELDGVFITSPDFCHEEQALAALERKIPIYLEKPMAISIEGCDRIMKMAHDNKTKLFLGHNMRYMPFILKMKEIVDSGTIGEVRAIWCRHFVAYGGDAYFRDWHSERKYANSLLLQKGAHDIDIIHWLAGSYTERVCGMGNLTVYDKCKRRNPDEKGQPAFVAAHWPPLEQEGFSPNIDVEDHEMILMQLKNGVQASYMQCHYTPDSCRNYTVIGTKGRMENYGFGEGGTIEVWTNREGPFRLHGDQTIKVSEGAGGHNGGDQAIVAGFIKYLRGEVTPYSSPQASRYSVATGCKGAESHRNGNMPLDIPPLSQELEDYQF